MKNSIHRPAGGPAASALCVLTLTFAACIGAPETDAPSWSAVVETADSGQGGVLRCDESGASCTPLAQGASVPSGSLVQTTRGARVRLDLGGASLDLAGEAQVVLSSSESHTARVARGSATLTTTAADGSADPTKIRLRVLDHVADVGPSAAVAVIVSAADRASLTVHRGSLALDPSASGVTPLRAGDSARLDLGVPADARAAFEGVAAPIEDAPKPARESAETLLPAATPRGLGTITARVPGTSEVVSGVRLVAHAVRVTVRDGFARTEVEEELANDTARVLEGRFAFPVPPGASISRLALWVGKDLVEGEIVEKARAASIFKGIVDDTVRPRDPALLEWVSGSELALKIFPMPPHGSRKVVLAYDEALAAPGGRVRYVYPLSLGAARANTIDRFSIAVTADDGRAAPSGAMTPGYAASITTGAHGLTVGYSAERFTPPGDFVLSYDAGTTGAAELSTFEGDASEPAAPRGREPASPPAAGDGRTAFASLRMTVALPPGSAPPARVRRDRAIVLDTSASQSKETLSGATDLTLALLRALDEGERFTVLACDSACDAYPADGLAPASDASIDALAAWLADRAPGGSSDVAGALVQAADRLDRSGSGQVVYLGDGAASSGELSADRIAARARPAIEARHIDLRLLGAGASLDEPMLQALAAALGGAYERVATGEPLARRAPSIALGLRMPVVTSPRLELSAAFGDVYPRALPNVRLGQELVVHARLDPRFDRGEAKLSGQLGGAPYVLAKTIAAPSISLEKNPLLPHFWADARIADLEASGGPSVATEVVDLSKRFHVLSHRTSLLVLENDRMFAEFGVPRTKGNDTSADPWAAGGPSNAGGASSRDASAALEAAQAADPMAARGNLWGSDLGDSFGAGGLGLSGAGEGGGGRGDGIGLGAVGTIGRGSSAGSGEGFGSGHGRLGGSHKVSPPRVRMGATQVSGRLPPEIIQRIVRQQFGRFRACYMDGLMRNPNLGGRVSVRFLIGPSGAVMTAANGGSDLPDEAVVACVVRAFAGLSFPEVEDGNVTVIYPIVFAPEDSDASTPQARRDAPQPMPEPSRNPPAEPRSARDMWPPQPAEPSGPRALIRASNDGWRSNGEETLVKLRRDVVTSEASRAKRQALVRGLLANGRFPEALTEATRFAELDPDLASARELMAHAYAVNGEAEKALSALDSLAEVAARSTPAHVRAARAYEAAGDERRACAHWRSLAELDPSSEPAQHEGRRCRARVLGERDAVAGELAAMSKKGPLATKLAAALEQGSAPPAESFSASPGQLEVKVTCAAGVEACPTAIVIDPGGTVVSPWLPASARSGKGSVALSWVNYGTYRALLVGGDEGARGEVEVRALGSVARFAFTRGGLQTVAAAVVTDI